MDWRAEQLIVFLGKPLRYYFIFFRPKVRMGSLVLLKGKGCASLRYTADGEQNLWLHV